MKNAIVASKTRVAARTRNFRVGDELRSFPMPAGDQRPSLFGDILAGYRARERPKFLKSANKRVFSETVCVGLLGWRAIAEPAAPKGVQRRFEGGSKYLLMRVAGKKDLPPGLLLPTCRSRRPTVVGVRKPTGGSHRQCLAGNTFSPHRGTAQEERASIGVRASSQHGTSPAG